MQKKLHQIRRYIVRYSALAVALCMVCLPFLSFPAAAAEGEFVLLSGSVSFNATSYQLGGDRVSVSYPYSDTVGVSSNISNTTLSGFCGGFFGLSHVSAGQYRYSYRLAISSSSFSSDNVSRYDSPVLVAYRGSSIAGYYGVQNLSYAIDRSSSGNVLYLTETFEITIPSEANYTSLYIQSSSFNFNGSVGSSLNITCTLYEFNGWKFSSNAVLDGLDGIQDSMDQVTTPSADDQNASNQFGDDVTDKNDQSQDVLDKMESLDKPTVGTNGSGGMVIGGTTVDPMGQLDMQWYGQYTSVLGTIFGSSHITAMFLIFLGLVLVSYVMFGKR